MEQRIGRVYYYDAYYLHTQEYKSTRPLLHEAYGFVTEDIDDIVVEFILPQKETTNDVIKGLVVPRGALRVQVQNATFPHDTESMIGTQVYVYWRDVVYVANMPQRESSTMETCGILTGSHEKCIVISQPRTTRIDPLPERPHKDENAVFLMIPFSLVANISTQKDRTQP